jgi:hypothetical protein
VSIDDRVVTIRNFGRTKGSLGARTISTSSSRQKIVLVLDPNK